MNLSERFIRGLQSYNLSLDDINTSGYRYCGGDKGRHLNYFTTIFKNKPFPPHKSFCVCGKDIIENCYICDKSLNYDSIIVSGNCCIKKFIDNSGRTCEVCQKPHQNRKDNKCKDCRTKAKIEANKGHCLKCNYKIDPKYIYCYPCHLNKTKFV